MPSMCHNASRHHWFPISNGSSIWLLLSMLVAGHAAVAGRPEPSVEAILAARFQRVIGPETGGAAVFPDTTSDWMHHTLQMPTVDFDGTTWRMWFAASTTTTEPGFPYGFVERIGLAVSRDGLNWEIANGGRPVLDLGPTGRFDHKGVTHPFVLRVGDTFMMWYGGIDGRAGKDVGVGPDHVRVEQIGLATSSDGIRWTRAAGGKPVLTNGPPGTIDAVQATGCHVIRRGDEYVMWYGAYDGIHRIGVATSPDGIRWTKANGGRPVAGLRGGQQLGPSVYFDGRRYLMLYNTDWSTGGGPTGLWTAFGATSPDGIRWEPAWDHRSVLGPAPPGNFGSANVTVGNNHVTHPTKMIWYDGGVRVWYAAEGHEPAAGSPHAHQAIGLMEARIAPRGENRGE